MISSENQLGKIPQLHVAAKSGRSGKSLCRTMIVYVAEHPTSLLKVDEIC